MDIKGKVIQLLPEQTGVSKKGEWKKKDFIIETQGQYPKKICFSIWGDKVDQYATIAEGQEITVFFDLESREYNSRWYTDVRAWKIEEESSPLSPPLPTEEPPHQEETTETDDLPF